MNTRLLLLSDEELRTVWEALMLQRRMLVPGDPEWDDLMRVLSRVNEMMSRDY